MFVKVKTNKHRYSRWKSGLIQCFGKVVLEDDLFNQFISNLAQRSQMNQLLHFIAFKKTKIVYEFSFMSVDLKIVS